MRSATGCALLAALLCCFLPTIAHAQTTEMWNRRAVALDLAPSAAGPGLWDVTALADILAHDVTSLRSLSTEFLLYVNGVETAGPLSVDIQLNGATGDCLSGCGSNCGSLYVDGALNTLLCREEGPGSCDCGYWLAPVFPPIPATQGDEIMVLLRPAPGAFPDADPSDDQLMVTLGARPPGWNRRVAEIQIQPAAGAPAKQAASTFDVFPLIEVEGSGFSAYLDMSMELELLVNGTQAVPPIVIDPAIETLPWDCEDMCGTNCGGMYFDGAVNTMTCHLDGPIGPGVNDCDCGHWIKAEFPGVPMTAGDEIMVILRPAPGAVPEPETGDDQAMVVFNGRSNGWNRGLGEITIMGTANGNKTDQFFDVWVDVSYEASGLLGAVDVSSELELLVNGAPVSPTPNIQVARMEGGGVDCETGCGSNCGGLYVDGVINTMTCREDGIIGPGVFDCDCGYWIKSNWPEVPLHPGDEIMVILRPAPGAVPEPMMEDDVAMRTFDVPAGWNRRVHALSVRPSASVPVKDSFFDVWTVVELEASNTLSDHLNLSSELVLQVNGAEVAQQLLNMQVAGPSGDCESGCGSNCGGLYVDGVINTMTCRKDGMISPGVYDCDCGHWILAPSFPGVGLSPGDEIMVLLRPAPGALPEHDPMGDQLTHIMDSTPTGWNRGIRSIAIGPDPMGGFEIGVSAHVESQSALDFLDLGYQIMVEADGQTIDTELVALSLVSSGPLPKAVLCDAGCLPSDCATAYPVDPQNTLTAGCVHSVELGGCSCGVDVHSVIPGVVFPPGATEIVVKLLPTPDALPELPGLEGDDEERTDGGRTDTEPPPSSLAFNLEQNQPNPFNPRTLIAFTTAVQGRVRLDIFDVRGELVRSLLDEDLPPGTHSVSWDGRDDQGRRASSGQYLYRIETQEWSDTRKMTLVK